MIGTSKLHDGRRTNDRTKRRLSPKPAEIDAVDEAIIGDLTAGTIERMTRDELVRVILSAKLPTLTSEDIDWQLAFYDCETLRRLAHRSQQCCMNRRRPTSSKVADESLGHHFWTGAQSW
ncbi:MAG: hypothetical protein SGI77_16990 [Pirellulaceae bacterium]|nr:hypothetical protein [Pirellulaceae bacterium]